jgi:hypothetical protein
MIGLSFPSFSDCSSDTWPLIPNRCDQMIIDAQARIIAVQGRLIRNYQSLVNLTPHDHDHPHPVGASYG